MWLLAHLVSHPEVRHLLLIGAFRDNEVDPAHPLVRALEAIREAGGRVEQIILAPLPPVNIGRLVADALQCEPQRAQPLAHLVQEKTGGNPFFAIQFLSALVEEALVTFDHGEARWSWDLARTTCGPTPPWSSAFEAPRACSPPDCRLTVTKKMALPIQ